MSLNNANRQVVIWLATGCFLIFVMVIIGGVTRLTGSGLSMVDWSYLIGSLPPMTEEAWQQSFDSYKEFPEYEIQPHGFNVEDYKRIFWWEYIHRMLGRAIGIVFIVPFFYFLYTRKIKGNLLNKVLILFALGALQGFVGWFMVKSGLVNVPHVSHYRLALHLVMAFLTFAWALWIILEIIYPHRRKKTHTVIRGFCITMLIVLFIQIVYGAFVAGLKAGLFYNTFPKMGDRWIAEGVFAMDPLYRNFLEGIAGVQFVHRYVAILILVVEILFFVFAMRKNLDGELKSALKLGMIMVLLQEALGIFTLIFAVPISLGLLHQVGAFMLLGVMIYILRLSRHTRIPIST